MNFSPSFAPRGVCIMLAAVVLGCGRSGGTRDFERGLAAYEARDFVKADKFLEKSLQYAPDDVDRLVCLARVKIERGELVNARALVMRASALAAGDVDVRLLEGHLAWHAKDYVRAAEIFTGIAEDAGLGEDVRAQGYAGLGVVEMTRENRHLARIALLRAIRLDRRNAAAWYHLGFLYRDGFAYLEAALEQFEIFVRLETSASPRVQKVQRTVIPALKESIARRLTDAPGAGKRDSAACSTAIAKAETAEKKGSFRTACQLYKEALGADALSYPAALGLAKTLKRTDQSKSGQTKALETFKLACSLRPSAVSTFLTAGAMALRLGFHAQAVEIYSRALAANPTSYDALDGLIRALRSGGRNALTAQAYGEYRKFLAGRKAK